MNVGFLWVRRIRGTRHRKRVQTTIPSKKIYIKMDDNLFFFQKKQSFGFIFFLFLTAGRRRSSFRSRSRHLFRGGNQNFSRTNIFSYLVFFLVARQIFSSVLSINVVLFVPFLFYFILFYFFFFKLAWQSALSACGATAGQFELLLLKVTNEKEVGPDNALRYPNKKMNPNVTQLTTVPVRLVHKRRH